MKPNQLQKWADKVTAELTKTSDRGTSADQCRKVIGRDAGNGYVIVATDGYRALLRRGDPTLPAHNTEKLTATPMDQSVGADALLGAIKRMRAVNFDRMLGTVFITGRTGSVTVATIDVEDRTEAIERVPAMDPPRFRICVNIRYLLGGLMPGFRVTWREGRDVVTCESPTGDYRLVIMPVKSSAFLDIETDHVDTNYEGTEVAA